MHVLSHIWIFTPLRTVACQDPLSMGFPRQEYGSGLSFSASGNLLDLRIEPVSLASPALASGFFYHCATWEAPNPRVNEWKSLSRVWLFVTCGLYSSCNSPGQNTGVGGLPCFRGSSQPRDQTQVSALQVYSLQSESQGKPIPG